MPCLYIPLSFFLRNTFCISVLLHLKIYVIFAFDYRGTVVNREPSQDGHGTVYDIATVVNGETYIIQRGSFDLAPTGNENAPLTGMGWPEGTVLNVRMLTDYATPESGKTKLPGNATPIKTKPQYNPNPTIAREEMRRQNITDALRGIAPFAAGVGVSGFGLYKMGRLPDYIEGERTGTGIAIYLGGLVVVGAAVGMAWGGTPNKQGKAIVNISGFTFCAGVAYLATRTLFKKSPKISLIASAILGASLVIYGNNKDAIDKKVKQALGLSTAYTEPDTGRPAVAPKIMTVVPI
mgnify:FL=1